MGRSSSPVIFDLKREAVFSACFFHDTDHEVSWNDIFNVNAIRSLKEKGDFEIFSKTYVVEEINFPQISVKNFISEKIISPRGIDEIYANAVNFVDTWTQPRNRLYFPTRKVTLHLGYTLINEVPHYGVACVKNRKYKISLNEVVVDTQRGDYWLI